MIAVTEGVVFLIVSASALVFGGVAVMVGTRRGHKPALPFILGFLLGPIGVIAVLLLPRKEILTRRVSEQSFADGEVARGAQEAFATVTPEPGVAKPDPILVVDNVRRTFGGVTAVDVDHVEIQRGSITALIGPNGAGKTTFFNLLTGFDEPDSGTWRFEGMLMSDIAAHDAARLGMVRTFQLTKSLTRMSVIENMKLGATGQTGEHWWKGLFPFMWRQQEKEIERRADELLARFKLDHMRNEYAGTLSGGQRKLLEMSRALMTDPTLVMLDEPMAGVNPALKQSLNAHIEGLRDQGMTVLFVEHDMDMVHDISDWVIVMAEGRVIAEGTPDQISSNPEVIDAYLGAHQGKSMLEEL